MGDADELKCSQCMKSFVFKQRNPYLLRCLHPICENCLEPQEDTVHCKVCSVIGQKRADPQLDHVRLKEYVLCVAKENPDHLKCTNQSDGKSAKVYCFECNHFLCDGCLSFHSQIDSTKNHKSVRLSELTTQHLTEWQTKETCSSHRDYPVSLFCHETACRRLICLLCFTQKHSGHNTEDIDEAYELEKGQLVQASHHLKTREAAVRELIAKRNEVEEKKTQVREIFAHLREAVSRRRQQLLQIMDYQDGTKESREDRARLLQNTAMRLRRIYQVAMAFHKDPEYRALVDEVNGHNKPADFKFHYDSVALRNVISQIQAFGQVRTIQPESQC